ncbi:MAG: hypothetical protein AAFV45_09710 [Pseudomonadota bacterium]
MRTNGWRQYDKARLSTSLGILLKTMALVLMAAVVAPIGATTTLADPNASKTLQTNTAQLSAPVKVGVMSGGSPFQALRGSWSGAGLIQLENGSNESIRCRAYYTTKSAGARLGMSVRCASPASKIDLRAGLDLSGAGQINGTWEERTFNANGTAVGRASSTSMRLQIAGTLSGTVSVILDGKSQQISIFSSNAGLNGVTIRLQKSRS